MELEKLPEVTISERFSALANDASQELVESAVVMKYRDVLEIVEYKDDGFSPALMVDIVYDRGGEAQCIEIDLTRSDEPPPLH